MPRFVKIPVMNAAMRREKVQDISHFVFDYRERAATAQGTDPMLGTDTMGTGYVTMLRHYIQRSPGIPASLQSEADRHSERLTTILRAFNPIMRRHRAYGALDSSKLARLARPGLSAREFDFEAGRAYKHREAETRIRQIKIAVVGDFNYRARASDARYAPNMAKLIHVISQACVVAGVPCAAYGTRGHLGLKYEDRNADGSVIREGDTVSREHSVTAVLKDYGDEMNGPTFALLTDEDAFSLAYCSTLFGQGSNNGNGGIEYARAKGADFIVACGHFPRAEELALADVHMPAGAAIDATIERVAVALEKRLADA